LSGRSRRQDARCIRARGRGTAGPLVRLHRARCPGRRGCAARRARVDRMGVARTDMGAPRRNGGRRLRRAGDSEALMSIAARLGLPDVFQAALLLLPFGLALAPHLGGFTVGGLAVPKFDPRRRRALRVGGPLALAAAVAVVIPFSALRAETLRLAAADV